MMQGDTCKIGIRITNNVGSDVTPSDIRDVEISIGKLRKTYAKGDLQFYEGLWLFPMSQKESFDYLPAAQKAQVRVAWSNGVIEGKQIYGIRVDESMSKEVL